MKVPFVVVNVRVKTRDNRQRRNVVRDVVSLRETTS